MRWTMILALAAFGMSATSEAASTSVDPGPPPTWEQFRGLAEAAVKNTALDEDSLKFKWKKGFILSKDKKHPAYFTCGLANGKNTFGGYVGYRAFQVFVANGRVQKILWSESPTDMWSTTCNEIFASPNFPDLPEAPKG
jgi:hypothetical protein